MESRCASLLVWAIRIPRPAETGHRVYNQCSIVQKKSMPKPRSDAWSCEGVSRVLVSRPMPTDASVPPLRRSRARAARAVRDGGVIGGWSSRSRSTDVPRSTFLDLRRRSTSLTLSSPPAWPDVDATVPSASSLCRRSSDDRRDVSFEVLLHPAWPNSERVRNLT